MINSITIENFLSHKSTFLPLHPGVNVFLGESDIGKTAIFDAVRKVVENRPAGDDFISWWGGDCSVTLDLTEGQAVEWANRGRQATYILSDSKKPKREDTIFKAFGQKVPEEIAATLDMESINFQHQLTNSFLFESSPGEVAKYLNSIVNLDVIDTALYNINRRLKQERNLLSNEQTSAYQLEEELKQFSWLDKAAGKLAELEIDQQDLDSLKSSRSELNTEVYRVIALEERTLKFERLTAFEGDINALSLLNNEIDNLCSEYDGLKDLIVAAERCEVTYLEASKIAIAEGSVNNLSTQLEEIASLRKERMQLKFIIHKIRDIEAQVEEHSLSLDNREKTFHKLMPDVCPLCGRGGL